MPKIHLVSQRNKILLSSPTRTVTSEWIVAVCWVTNYIWQVLDHDSYICICMCMWSRSWTVHKIKTIEGSLKLRLTVNRVPIYVLNLKDTQCSSTTLPVILTVNFGFYFRVFRGERICTLMHLQFACRVVYVSPIALFRDQRCVVTCFWGSVACLVAYLYLLLAWWHDCT